MSASATSTYQQREGTTSSPFQRQEIYGGEIDLRARRIDAYDRFSERC